MKNPFVNPKYFVWIYASDGNIYSIIPFEKKEQAYKRRDLLQRLSYTCSVERELPCEWNDAGVSILV
jgi:hypothetical protein